MSNPAPEGSWTRERMAKLLDITPRHLNYLAQNGVVPAPQGGEWKSAECIVKYIRYLRDGAGSGSKESKAIKQKAEASIAVMEEAKMKGTLCLRSDYNTNLADAIAQGVSKISRLKSLNTAQKDAVFSALREIKLPDLEPEVEDTEEADEAEE